MTNATVKPARTPLVIEEQIVKVHRGSPLPQGWDFAQLIYTTVDLFGEWDVILVTRAVPE